MHCFRNRSSFVLCLPSLPASSGKLRPLAAASDLGDQWASNRLSNLLVDGRRYKSLAGRVHIQQSTAEESCPNTTQLQPPPPPPPPPNPTPTIHFNSFRIQWSVCVLRSTPRHTPSTDIRLRWLVRSFEKNYQVSTDSLESGSHPFTRSMAW